MCIASIMQTWYLCLFHTQVYCIVCIFPHVTQKCVVLTLSIPRYHLKLVNKPFYGFSQYMCNSVEVVKKKCRSGKCLIGLTHCPHLPDLLSDRQERHFDSSDTPLQLRCGGYNNPNLHM